MVQDSPVPPRVLLVHRPLCGVIGDVRLDGLQLSLVPHDAVVVTAPPEASFEFGLAVVADAADVGTGGQGSVGANYMAKGRMGTPRGCPLEADHGVVGLGGHEPIASNIFARSGAKRGLGGLPNRGFWGSWVFQKTVASLSSRVAVTPPAAGSASAWLAPR